MKIRALVFSLLFSAFFLFATLEEAAAQGSGPQDERAAAFVAGKADASETFGESEGALLFGTGVFSIASFFTVLFLAGSTHRRNRERIEKMGNDV